MRCWLNCVCALGLVLALGACSNESQVVWNVRFASEPIKTATDALTLRVSRGGCDITANIYSATLRSGEMGDGEMSFPSVGALDAGLHGFRAIARRSDCTVVASTCAEVGIERGQSRTITLELSSPDPRDRCRGSCDEGTCSDDDLNPAIDLDVGPDTPSDGAADANDADADSGDDGNVNPDAVDGDPDAETDADLPDPTGDVITNVSRDDNDEINALRLGRYFAYGGSFIEEAGSVHGFFCASAKPYVEGEAPDDGRASPYERHLVLYARSEDGKRFGEPKALIASALPVSPEVEPTGRSLNHSACRNSVARVGDQYYLVFESPNVDAAELGSLYIARASAIDGPYRVWSGTSWTLPTDQTWAPIVLPGMWADEDGRNRATAWRTGRCFVANSGVCGAMGFEDGDTLQCCLMSEPDNVPFSIHGNPFGGAGAPRIAPALGGRGLRVLYADTTLGDPERPYQIARRVRSVRITFDETEAPVVSVPQDVAGEGSVGAGQLLRAEEHFLLVAREQAGTDTPRLVIRESSDGSSFGPARTLATLGLTNHEFARHAVLLTDADVRFPTRRTTFLYVDRLRNTRSIFSGGVNGGFPGVPIYRTALQMWPHEVEFSAGEPALVTPNAHELATLTPGRPVVQRVDRDHEGCALRVCGDGLGEAVPGEANIELRRVRSDQGFVRTPVSTGPALVSTYAVDGTMARYEEHPVTRSFRSCICVPSLPPAFDDPNVRGMVDVVRTDTGMRTRVELSQHNREGESWGARSDDAFVFSPINVHSMTTPVETETNSQVTVCGSGLHGEIRVFGHWVGVDEDASALANGWTEWRTTPIEAGYRLRPQFDAETGTRCIRVNVPRTEFDLRDTLIGSGSLEIEFVQGEDTSTGPRLLIDGDTHW